MKDLLTIEVESVIPKLFHLSGGVVKKFERIQYENSPSTCDLFLTVTVCILHCRVSPDRRSCVRRQPDSGGDRTKSGSGDPCAGAETPESPLAQFSWFRQMGPSFSVPAQNVRVLSEPWEFYRTLKVDCDEGKM